MPDQHPHDSHAKVHRDLHLGDPGPKGPDVEHLQHNLNNLAHDMPHLGLDHVKEDGEFGPHTAHAAAEAGYALGERSALTHHAAVTTHEQEILRHPDTRSDAAKQRAQDHQKELAQRATHHSGVRQKILDYCEWGVAHEPEIHYSHARPVPFGSTDNQTLPMTQDCSGFSTAAYHKAGAPDPNGTHYDGEAYTGLMLNHLPTIPKTQAKKGDLVLFDNSHVVILKEDGTAADPLCYSHGQEGGPSIYPISVESRAHAGQPVIYKKGL